MRILLLSAYDAASHRRWRRGMVDYFSDCEWTVLSLPARYFSWRVRGNSLSWAFAERETLAAGYDLVIATSMVDLSALKGFVPELAAVPSVLYFHENQFAYPKSSNQHASVEPQVLNLYGALAADYLLFNSEFNRQSFIEGAAELLRKMPDHVPPGLPEQLLSKSEVIPVPLEQHCYEAGEEGGWPAKTPARPLRLVWAARFEYDKGGELLQRVLQGLKAKGCNFELAVLGERFRHSPAVFEAIESEFEDQLVQFGFVEGIEDYRALLSGADIVLSTALHEFQGLAVLEAVAAGCIPVVPARLAYREMYPAECQYQGESQAQEAEMAVSKILEFWGCIRGGEEPGPLTVDVEGYSWAALGERYRRVFEALT